MISYLKNENLEDLIGSKKVVVDFYADWCMPCSMLGDIMEEVVEEEPNLNILKVNVDEHADIAKKFGVMSIPLVLLYKDGKIEKKHVGLMEKDEFKDFIK